MAEAILSVKVSTKSDSYGEEWNDNRAEFWRSIYIKDRFETSDDHSADKMEYRFLTKFGSELRSHLTRHFNEAWKVEGRDRGSGFSEIQDLQNHRISQIVLRPRIVGYGSMDFNIEISGLTNIVDLFESNLDSFEAFMEIYIPIAFDESLRHWCLQPLEFRISPDSKLTQSFNERKVEGNVVAPRLENDSTNRKREWLWMIANGSLIVPVILSLGVMFVWQEQISEQRELISKNMQSIQESKDKVINSQAARIMSLEKNLFQIEKKQRFLR